MKNFQQFLKIVEYLIVTVLIIGLLSFIVYMFIPTPTKTMRNFFVALREQNYEKAYNMIDGQYKIKRGSFEKFSKEYYQALENGTRTKSIKIVSVDKWEKVNQRSVEVEVTVLFNGKMTPTYGTYVLENIPSKGWRIVENISHLNKKATSVKTGETTTQTNP
ncbi:MAG: NTF2-like N-terminal transpeptidase domain-containing protein [Caldisericia bacterium]|nr:NTF2-like N-terminal transpeptidase domain-containing protein [Caldisericia bacterium]